VRRISTMLFVALAVAVPTLAHAQVSDEVTYYHTDAVGSVRVVTDAGGQVVARYDYLPFGELWPASPVGGETRQFGGKERDSESGLDYVGARYYASQTGRFTTVDPFLDVHKALVDPQQWNRYTYVRNNPLRYVDPDGRAIETLWDAFNLALDVTSLGANIAAGNWGGAALDVGGLLLDAGATALPLVPGGAGSSIRAWRIAENAKAGRAFEHAVLDALGAVKGEGAVSEIATRVTTIPDLPIGKFFGVTEIKNVQNLSFSKQLQAQFAAAQTAGLPFNLVVSSRTERISLRVRQAIEQTKGRIFIYDEKLRKFSEAAFDEYGNLAR
jgi:RHS repeat-associated protein